MAVSVRFTGLAGLRTELLQIPEAMEQSAIRQMSQFAYDAAFRDASSHNRTGSLVRSLYNRAIPRGREVGHDPQVAPHAIFVLFGTRPHKIRPRDKKALRWVGAGGRFAFAKEVNHPGYIGDSYLFRAADNAIRQFNQIINQATNEAR